MITRDLILLSQGKLAASKNVQLIDKAPSVNPLVQETIEETLLT